MILSYIAVRVRIAVIFLESYLLISVKIKNIPILLSINFSMGFVSLLNY